MNKRLLYIALTLTILIIFALVVYKSIVRNKNNLYSATTTVDKNEWTTITDCRDIKLYLWDGENPSESGLENEQDIIIDYENKILSVGLPESIYGSRKRLEINYTKPSDYENCSPDVKKLVEVTVHP